MNPQTTETDRPVADPLFDAARRSMCEPAVARPHDAGRRRAQMKTTHTKKRGRGRKQWAFRRIMAAALGSGIVAAGVVEPDGSVRFNRNPVRKTDARHSRASG